MRRKVQRKLRLNRQRLVQMVCMDEILLMEVPVVVEVAWQVQMGVSGQLLMEMVPVVVQVQVGVSVQI